MPILAYRKGMKSVDLGIGKTYADIGQTVCEMFGVKKVPNGESFYNKLDRR